MRPKVQWIYSWYIFCVVNHNLCRFECGRVLDPFTLLSFHIYEKLFEESPGELIKNKGVHTIHIVGCAIFADGVNLDFILLRCSQVRTDIVLELFESKVF